VTTSDIELHGILELARTAAHEAGVLIGARPVSGLQPISKSSPTDLVTEMDRASEQLILQMIIDCRPDDGIIAEEGSSKPSRSGISWLIDPIDGTTNYLRGIPNYAISIAATDGDEVLAGVVYDPTLEETFTATRRHGAALNDTPIACADTPLAEAIIGTGFSYSSSRRARQAKVLQSILPAVGDIRRPGSAAVSLCWVACGRLDAFFEAHLQPWDFAAGVLIAREAGANFEVTDDYTDGSLIVVSAPSVTSGLRQILIHTM
jgi:myo-inositol-1(or 4)-monophosphatase